MPKPIYILNGPNLNLLGVREPQIYGAQTLADLDLLTAARAEQRGYETVFRQSNHEGQLIDWIHEARASGSAVIINAGAYTHTSVALFDALKAVDLPVIEVHLSNVHKREAFRHHSYISAAADGVIVGLGSHGYELAIDAAAALIAGRESAP
jgi:3-dehydroquinate dehydratase-2